MPLPENESGPQRTTALEELRGRASACRIRAAGLVREANGLDALANQIEEIAKCASQLNNGCDGPVPTIGVGSDAEQALWRLIIRDSRG